MGYQSRDWRQADPSRNYGRFRNQDESRGMRSDFDRPDSDDDWSRSAEGIGDYGGYGGRGGGYGSQRYESGGQYGGYAEEESAYRGDYSPRRFRYGQSDWRDDSNENERYGFGSSRGGESRFGREDYGRGDYGGGGRRGFGRDFEGSRSGRNEGDFRTQPWRDRPMEGWSGERYPHRDFTYGRGGDYGAGSSSGRYGGGEQNWRAGSMTSSYDSGYGSGGGYGSGRYGAESYGSSGSSGLTNWGRGSHRGKGPKGYERSDDRLKEVICERLSDDPDIDASEISINVTGGTVRLTGSVDSREEKYSVEEMIANCSGVKDVDNQLRVQSGRSQSGQSQRETSGRDTSSGSYGTSGASSQESYGQSTSRSTSTTTGTSSSKKQ